MNRDIETLAVEIPLLNPNEPQVLISELPVSNGQMVEAGQTLCVLETTKASQELTAPGRGYVAGLSTSAGDTVTAGEILLWLSADPQWAPDQGPAGGDQARPTGLRITEPARRLAAERGLDLELLPSGTLITETVVRAHLAKDPPDLSHLQPKYAPEDLIIYGAGGHGAAVLELVKAARAGQVVGFIDDGRKPGERVLDAEVIGGGEILAELAKRGLKRAINAVGGIGDISSRVQVFEWIDEQSFDLPTVLHPSAVIEPSAELAQGIQVFPLAYVGSRVHIGRGSIVNTAVVVSHDCRLGAVVNVSPGTMLAGGVIVEDQVLIGMGVTINLNVTVGRGARIGNSAVIKADVPAHAVVKAGGVWPAV